MASEASSVAISEGGVRQTDFSSDTTVPGKIRRRYQGLCTGLDTPFASVSYALPGKWKKGGMIPPMDKGPRRCWWLCRIMQAQRTSMSSQLVRIVTDSSLGFVVPRLICPGGTHGTASANNTADMLPTWQARA